MKVKELIERLKEFDENLEVAVYCNEDTDLVRQIRVETKDNHCYDQDYHILDVEDDLFKCVMISSEALPLNYNEYSLLKYEEDDEEEE